MLRLAVFSALFGLTSTFNFNAGLSTGLGCLVTKNMLFSQGNFIRFLKKEEMDQYKKYKKEAAAFKAKIDDAFDKAEENEAKNATVPPMPVKPSMPAFCTGPDTTLYIFGSCSVQNNKIYINKNFARDLDEAEKKKMSDFIALMASQMPGSTPPKPQKGLEFCTELNFL
ncbi:unnamed protein product [Caenorhabditis auriculariae]|uniref:Pepsin inhibitor-3-like repeated domain-containing protein n=1 Tax=Caenorhabditis auriculariae TaxID=2777116 RepID=A0A8S1H059_9PELO|nr:unnamed protein product [Caenorhabditis auriculariae]